MSLNLVITMMDRDRRESMEAIFKSVGLPMSLTMLGRGTATMEHLSLNGLKATEKAVLSTVADSDKTRQLMLAVAEKLRTLPPVTIYEPEYVEAVVEAGDPSELSIEHEGSTWLVTGTWLERLIQDINFDDYESRNYFDQQLRKCGLFARLEEMGIQDGDTVDIYDFQFDYQK